MSDTPMVTFSSVDNPNTWNIEGESKCLVFASPSEAKRAEEMFTAMQRELAAERERADRLIAFLADDALAMTYQSLAQYRQAAINAARRK